MTLQTLNFRFCLFISVVQTSSFLEDFFSGLSSNRWGHPLLRNIGTPPFCWARRFESSRLYTHLTSRDVLFWYLLFQDDGCVCIESETYMFWTAGFRKWMPSQTKFNEHVHELTNKRSAETWKDSWDSHFGPALIFLRDNALEGRFLHLQLWDKPLGDKAFQVGVLAGPVRKHFPAKFSCQCHGIWICDSALVRDASVVRGLWPDVNRIVWNLVKNCLNPPRLTPSTWRWL